jgi:RNA polymerase sigma-70 factor (ECF subfamily)
MQGLAICADTPRGPAGNPWSRPLTDLDHDLEIVERHRQGDPEAFAEVYRDYEETVYNVALRMSGDPFDAADLAQETFLRIYRHLGKFRGRSALKTWIYRVALNHCRSRLGRRRLPMQPLLGPDGESEREIPDPARGPEERALARDEGRRVMAALAGVPVAFREAVVLRDLEDLSYEEIAEVLGVRIGTVRSRIARGRDKLRQILENEP